MHCRHSFSYVNATFQKYSVAGPFERLSWSPSLNRSAWVALWVMQAQQERRLLYYQSSKTGGRLSLLFLEHDLKETGLRHFCPEARCRSAMAGQEHVACWAVQRDSSGSQAPELKGQTTFQISLAPADDFLLAAASLCSGISAALLLTKMAARAPAPQEQVAGCAVWESMVASSLASGQRMRRPMWDQRLGQSSYKSAIASLAFETRVASSASAAELGVFCGCRKGDRKHTFDALLLAAPEHSSAEDLLTMPPQWQSLPWCPAHCEVISVSGDSPPWHRPTCQQAPQKDSCISPNPRGRNSILHPILAFYHDHEAPWREREP
mmetsp:Transcript_87150/g.154286  ORF Transcript_87150/g.154286 Transcript_87150/m.154286 type:complete len:322 (-) Transcript_87150:1900-2865(-)